MDLNKQRNLFAIRLRRGRAPNVSAYNLANDTVTFLRKVIAQSKYTGINELLHIVKMEGRELSNAAPHEYVVHNMVLRVLKLIREEHGRLLKGMEDDDLPAEFDQTLSKLWHASTEENGSEDGQSPVRESEDGPPRSVDIKFLRKSIVTTLGEFVQEMEGARASIASEAPHHVHARDTVLTLGFSNTVVQFCREAATQRRFRLVIAQSSPDDTGSRMAATLRESYGDDKVTPRFDALNVIPDAQVYSAMAHAHKVVLGAHAVLADGGFLATAGTYAMCLAAKRYAVPVIVCAAFYKLTPLFVNDADQSRFNPMRSSMAVVDMDDATFMDNVDVYNSSFDYIPPELVTLYLMQSPGNAPSYVYRLVGEYYHAEDVLLAA